MLEVSDTRRPDAIKKVKLNSDDNDVIVSGGKADIQFEGDDYCTPSKLVYLDQYGEELGSTAKSGWVRIAKKFFENTDGSGDGKYFDGYVYGIKVDVSGNPAFGAGEDDTNINALGLSDRVYTGSEAIQVLANASTKTSVNVKYSIVRVSKDKTIQKVPTKTDTAGDANFDNWDNVSKIYNANYTVAPITDVTNCSIGDITKQRVNSDYDDYANADGQD